MNNFSIRYLIPAIACILLAAPLAAQDLVRANFHKQGTTNAPGVFGHHVGTKMFDCNTEPFTNLDATDTTPECLPDPAEQDGINISNVSGGGRWHFNVWDGNDGPAGANGRKVIMSFTAPEPGADCDTLEATLADMGLSGCGCSASCQVGVWIAADRLFKKGASTQDLGRFDIVELGGQDGPDLRIVYHEPLRICAASGHGNDRSWRVMQSGPCTGSIGIVAESVADVIIPPVGGTGQDEVLGQWKLPFRVTAQKVSSSDDGGGGGGGGGDDKPCRGKKCDS